MHPYILWEHIIFSDEKKWNLGGPDGFQHYRRDLRKPPRQTKRHQGGGGSVMNSDDYAHTLSGFLLPFAHLHYGIDFVFQQNGASIHTSYRTKEFFEEQGVGVLDWLAQSPDLNSIENLWSIMTQRVYSNRRQFDSVGELTQVAQQAWNQSRRAYYERSSASCRIGVLR